MCEGVGGEYQPSHTSRCGSFCTQSVLICTVNLRPIFGVLLMGVPAVETLGWALTTFRVHSSVTNTGQTPMYCGQWNNPASRTYSALLVPHCMLLIFFHFFVFRRRPRPC
jgi:hypothetical protein